VRISGYQFDAIEISVMRHSVAVSSNTYIEYNQGYTKSKAVKRDLGMF
jgi:hypothetical protein